jgi:carbon monoxide dehydrogenase subunit G
VKIVDEFTVTAPLARTWSVIRDPQKAASCVPGCRSVETIDESRYRAVVEVSLGPIRTEFNLVVTVVEERPPDFAATMTKGEEGGRASSVSVMTKLSLTSAGPDATLIAYESDVTMVGRLGNYGLGLMLRPSAANSSRTSSAASMQSWRRPRLMEDDRGPDALFRTEHDRRSNHATGSRRRR